MKNILFLATLVCIGTVSTIAFFKYLSAVNSDYQRHNVPVQSVPYNPKKINTNGEYQPYYGYTIVAMIEPKLVKMAEKIEEFIQRSSLARTYSALPASSYHMTLYSIYQCGSKMIPPVARWVNATGSIISNSSWFPEEVLQEQNTKATCLLEKYLAEPLHIKYATLNISKSSIKLTLEAEQNSLQRIRIFREKCIHIYEDADVSMEPIDKKLHIGLAYVYAPMGKIDVDELNQLNLLVRSFNGAKLFLPSVYLFDSMKRYISYEKGSEIDCRLLIE